MEESVCISSDSNPSSSPTLAVDLDDFEFPTAKLSDICGVSTALKTPKFSTKENPESDVFDGKLGVPKNLFSPTVDAAIDDLPGPSFGQSHKNEILPKTSSFYELSDTDSSDDTAKPGPVSTVEEVPGDSAGSSPLWHLRDCEAAKKRTITAPVHELSDSDNDRTGPADCSLRTVGLTDLTRSSSSDSPPPGNSSPKRYFSRISNESPPHKSNSTFKLDVPLTKNSSSDTLPPGSPTPLVCLSDDSTQPFPSAASLPSDIDSPLHQSNSEPLFSMSYSISEFVTQQGASSQPLDLNAGPNPKQKRAKNSAEAILERKRLKEIKAKEKAEKAAAAESLRRLRPGECLKYVTVVLDDRIITEYPWGQAVVRVLELSNVRHLVRMGRDPCTVQWTRDQVGSSTPVGENHIILLWSVDKLLTSIQFSTFIDTFAELKNRYPSHKLLLAVYGLHEYYKKQQKSEQRQKRANESQDPSGQPARKRKSAYEVTESQIEMELIALQVRLGISHKALSSPQDTACFLQVITKSVAELPFKLERERIDEERNWYAKGDSRNCARVDKDYNGLSQLWLQQLAQYNNSSLDTAKAIAQIYPTPLSLYEAYKEKATAKEKEQMLQEIVIKRGSSGGGRRLGPELSKKISIMFCQDKDVPLG